MNFKTLTVILSITLCSLLPTSKAQNYLEPCNSTIYCYGPLIETIQLSKHELVDDKVFVDLALKYEPEDVLANFAQLNIVGDVHDNATLVAMLDRFVEENFENGTEFEDWVPGDWHENPEFLSSITDNDLKSWANILHKFWHELGRKIKDDVKYSNKYSMHYVSHPVIVPGGRFKEFYYWDSYWIQKGLIVSEMTDTVRGMIENFFEMVEELGYVPNGGRIYYERSQPPLLMPMVKNYYDATRNLTFIQNNIATMEKEFDFFMDYRTVEFQKNGQTYRMARYNVDRKGPRPESYKKDYDLVESLNINQSEKDDIYANLKAGAESGWDFSSRWFVLNEGEQGNGNLSHVKTRDIIPVDLNGFIYWNAVIFQEFCDLVRPSYFCKRNYTIIASNWKKAIHDVLWDETMGSWFDYDFVRGSPRKEFYSTNVVPLWVKAHHDNTAITKILQYFVDSGASKYDAGIPSSLLPTGEQWDFPNGWAPLNHMVVEAFEYSGVQAARDFAFDIAQKWTRTNYWAYEKYGVMFEKYDVSCMGCAGSGGEYPVVIGFGWSNGVVFEFLKMYGNRITTSTNPTPTSPTPSSSPSIGKDSGAINIHMTLGFQIISYIVLRSAYFTFTQ